MREGIIAKQQDRVLDRITRFPGHDDDEIASALKIFSRQTVNQIGRRLSQKNLVRRELGTHGNLVNFAAAKGASDVESLSAQLRKSLCERGFGSLNRRRRSRARNRSERLDTDAR
jgi:hypothetical protein